MGHPVHVRGPNGEDGQVDSDELASMGQMPAGWTLATELPMYSGHTPSPPEKEPGIMSGVMGALSGIYGPLGKYLAAGAGATGQFSGTIPTKSVTDETRKAPTPREGSEAAEAYDKKAKADNPKEAIAGEVAGIGASMVGGLAGGRMAREPIRKMLERAVAPEVERKLGSRVTMELAKDAPQLARMDKIAPHAGSKMMERAIPKLSEKIRPQLVSEALSAKEAMRDLAPAVGGTIGGSIGWMMPGHWPALFGTEAGIAAGSKLAGRKLPHLIYGPFSASRMAATSPAVWNQASKIIPVGSTTASGAPGLADLMMFLSAHADDKE